MEDVSPHRYYSTDDGVLDAHEFLDQSSYPQHPETSPQRIAYDWSYEGYAGDSFVVFELFKNGDSTRIRLTHQAREDFPEGIPEFSRENCVGGWVYLIRKNLKPFVEQNAE